MYAGANNLHNNLICFQPQHTVCCSGSCQWLINGLIYQHTSQQHSYTHSTATMAAAAINLHELEQELTRTKSMFEQWSAAMLSRAQGCKSSHTSKLLAHKGQCVAFVLEGLP